MYSELVHRCSGIELKAPETINPKIKNKSFDEYREAQHFKL